MPEEQERGREEIFEIIMTENFSKLMSDNKPDPGSSENIKQYNTKKPLNLRHIIFKLQNVKDKEKNPKEIRGKKPPCLQKNKDRNYIQFLRNMQAIKDWS